MTYTVSGGALNSTQSYPSPNVRQKSNSTMHCEVIIIINLFVQYNTMRKITRNTKSNRCRHSRGDWNYFPFLQCDIIIILLYSPVGRTDWRRYCFRSMFVCVCVRVSVRSGPDNQTSCNGSKTVKATDFEFGRHVPRDTALKMFERGGVWPGSRDL